MIYLAAILLPLVLWAQSESELKAEIERTTHQLNAARNVYNNLPDKYAPQAKRAESHILRLEESLRQKAGQLHRLEMRQYIGQYMVTTNGNIGRLTEVDSNNHYYLKTLQGDPIATPALVKPLVGAEVTVNGVKGVVSGLSPDGKTAVVKTTTGATLSAPLQTITPERFTHTSAVSSAYSKTASLLERLGPRFDRKFSVASVVTSLGRGVNAADIEAASSKDECPTLSGSMDHFAELLKVDHDRWQKVALACERKNKAFNFASLREPSRNGIEGAKCSSQGRIEVTHTSGVVSTLVYSGPQTLTAITNVKRTGPSVTYQSTSQGWRVVSQLDRHKVEESWASYYSRVSCGQRKCTPEEFTGSTNSRGDEVASNENPFGLVAHEHTLATGEALMRVRRVLGARNGGPANFADACESLGGVVPKDMTFGAGGRAGSTTNGQN